MFYSNKGKIEFKKNIKLRMERNANTTLKLRYLAAVLFLEISISRELFTKMDILTTKKQKGIFS